MTEQEYILAGNIKALKLASDALLEVLLMEDDDYPVVLEDIARPDYPNLNEEELNRIRATVSVWYQSLLHHMDELEHED